MAGDLTITGGSLTTGPTLAGDGLSATFSVTATNDSTADLAVTVKNSVVDLNGNTLVPVTNTLTVDTTNPTASFTSALYDPNYDTNGVTEGAAGGRILLTGANMNTILGTGETASTDIKARLGWSNLTWDINGDDAGTVNVVFNALLSANKIASAKVLDASTLEIILTDDTLESTVGYGNTVTADTIDVATGFAVDLAGNVATGDAAANVALRIDGNQPALPDAFSFNFGAQAPTVMDENTGVDTAAATVAFDTADLMFIAGIAASGVTVGGGALVSGDGADVTLTVGGKVLTLSGFSAELDGTLVKFDDGSVLLTNEAGAATLRGGNAASGDQLIAGNLGDTLFGYAGGDVLTGGNGADVIYGGSGNDIIRGGVGSDYINGGTGVDTFRYTSNTTNDDGYDQIAGFAAEDVLNIMDIVDATMDDAWIASHAVQNGADTLVLLNGSESIRLLGVTAANLTVDNFLGS